MNQPTPTVTRRDVCRVVKRDFDTEDFDKVMALLSRIELREAHRVQLAALKVANGELEALRRQVELANCDYRDLLAMAEYPAYMRAGLGIYEIDESEQNEIIRADWEHYASWLNR